MVDPLEFVSKLALQEWWEGEIWLEDGGAEGSWRLGYRQSFCYKAGRSTAERERWTKSRLGRDENTNECRILNHLEITEALDGFFLGPDGHPGPTCRVWYSPRLVGLVNVSALWYVRPNLSSNDCFVDVCPIAVVGFLTRSTFTPDVAVPSSSTSSPVSSRLSVPASAKPRNDSSSAICCLASVWNPTHPPFPSSLQKTTPLRFEVAP